MARTGLWVLALFAAGLVGFAALGPGGERPGDGLRAMPAAAATVPTAIGGVIDENPPSSTPAGTATATAAVAAPLARTVQIGAYNDASVVSGGSGWTADTNLGGWSTLAAGPRSGGTFRSYLRFLVAGLPQGMQVDSALLVLTPMQGGARPVPVEADFVQDDWSEATINWNQQPLSTFRTGAATWQPGSSAPLNIDVTMAAQQWYACGGTSNNGLLLSADLASDWVGFGSRKSDTPPVLQVTYQRATSPVNCSAPPTSNVNLTPAQGISSSTTGAQIGGIDPNLFNNLLALGGTPYGALSIPRPPQPAPNQTPGSALPPLPYSTPPPGGPLSGLGTGSITLPFAPVAPPPTTTGP